MFPGMEISSPKIKKFPVLSQKILLIFWEMELSYNF